VHDVGQGVRRRRTAVDDQKRLTVVRPDPDLQAMLAGVGIEGDTTHLEPENLPGQHAVLEHTGGAARFDARAPRVEVGWGIDGRREALRRREAQVATVHRPHRGRLGEVQTHRALVRHCLSRIQIMFLVVHLQMQ
jgi:hypothetical protein